MRLSLLIVFISSLQELLLYQLQLVQALKYENFDEIYLAYEGEKEAIQQQTLTRADSISSTSSETDRYRSKINFKTYKSVHFEQLADADVKFLTQLGIKPILLERATLYWIGEKN